MEELLRSCGWDDRADWIMSRRKTLETAPSSSPLFAEALHDLESILVGMGSFSDVPMYPKSGTRLTRKEALDLQWDLTEVLGTTVRELLQSRQ
jgi:hypothetical protein